MNDPSYRRDCCEFQTCQCRQFVGFKDQKCQVCGHAECWHKIVRVTQDPRFESTRESAPVHPDFAEPE